ncbi:ClpXP protease specificity-enhancing factor SspB [Wolbachia endosymbiont of Pentidionis agamae]|uniref:ClpXP protease specificity-enhancing factor SspB n=1 Tax=Wolbachia endosymbiont of Pentidionis agamae TaxID=3110435 RepID=UPI002FD5C014
MATINYKELINLTKFQVVRHVLNFLLLDKTFVPNIYLTFFTSFEGVKIPSYLKKLHPEQMSIVLQHKFHILEMSEDKFSIHLSFNRKEEKITIPFFSISRFYDKNANFMLIFDKVNINTQQLDDNIISIDQLRQ